MLGAISPLKRGIAVPLHSKVVLPLRYSTSAVFSHALAVVAREDDFTFGILSSTPHREWARRHGSSLETRIRYTPSDCFETFPFPVETGAIASTMKQIDELRTSLMRDSDIGLTVVYNRVHSESDDAPAIRLLRKLHADLDQAMCDAYGWLDLNLDFGFHETVEGVRWAIGNAVIDALSPLGITHLDIPLRPERIWNAIQNSRQ